MKYNIENTKIKYIIGYPVVMDNGGGGQIIRDITSKLREKGWNISILDFTNQDLDFNILITFGCTYINPEFMGWVREKGILVINYPIFDRMKPLWQMKMLRPLMMKFPVQNSFKERKMIFDNANIIMVANNSEKRDIIEIYGANIDKIHVQKYCLADVFFEKVENISKSLFYDKYQIKDFIFCPASRIYPRKNQIRLIRALKGSGLKLVLNNTDVISGYNPQVFHNLVKNDSNIICLGRMDQDMLVSCYKNAEISISVSQAETAGLINLEAGFLGCKLVLSNLESLREYIQNRAVYVNQNDQQSILNGILESKKKTFDVEIIDFVRENYTWDKYVESFIKIINNKH